MDLKLRSACAARPDGEDGAATEDEESPGGVTEVRERLLKPELLPPPGLESFYIARLCLSLILRGARAGVESAHARLPEDADVHVALDANLT